MLCIGAEPTGATGHLPRYSWKYRGKHILLPRYFLVNNFYSFHLNEQRHLEWHIKRLKLYRELSAMRCVIGLNCCCGWGGGWCVSQDQDQQPSVSSEVLTTQYSAQITDTVSLASPSIQYCCIEVYWKSSVIWISLLLSKSNQVKSGSLLMQYDKRILLEWMDKKIKRKR